jgi:hypothetical protein
MYAGAFMAVIGILGDLHALFNTNIFGDIRIKYVHVMMPPVYNIFSLIRCGPMKGKCDQGMHIMVE